MFRNTCAMIAAIAALAACDRTNPAGGIGYFDPPPAPRFVPPEPGAVPRTAPAPLAGTPGIAPIGTVVVQSPTDGPFPTQTPVANAAGAALADTQVAGTSAATGGDANAASLAQDVTAALAATPLPGTGEGGLQPAMPGASDIGIDPNDDSIDLNASSQEVQVRERTAAQQRRDAAQQQLVVVQPEPVPQVDVSANIVQFSRQTTHPVGVRVYNRPAFRDRLQARATCRQFANDDEAQRQFLANGGPNTDRFNIDPDGDGFACRFDPEKYRSLEF
ncbi:MAG: hypothetical protein AAGE76_08055 [Pseudomonadota bacterium]